MALGDPSNVDHRVDCREIRYKHRSSLVEGQAVGNANTDISQGSGVCRESILSAEANDSITNLEIVRADVGSNAPNNTSGLDAEETDRKLNDSESDQNILNMLCQNHILKIKPFIALTYAEVQTGRVYFDFNFVLVKILSCMTLVVQTVDTTRSANIQSSHLV